MYSYLQKASANYCSYQNIAATSKWSQDNSFIEWKGWEQDVGHKEILLLQSTAESYSFWNSRQHSVLLLEVKTRCSG